MPRGTAAGCEGLDALLATPALTGDLAVFSTTDGVFQLLSEQKPDAALAHDYITIFKLLGPYGIEQCWVCAASLRERGLDPQIPFVVKATPLEADALRCKLTNCDVILRFRGVVLRILHRLPWLTDSAALLCLLSEDNELLLLQDGVIVAINGNRYLESLHNTPIRVYAPNEDPIARGLTGRISDDIISIDYTDFVRPTIEHSGQVTW